MSRNSNTYKTFNTSEKTPEGFYKVLNEEFSFDFDPCPLDPNYVVDGLKIPWGKRVYVNPPYGKAIRSWLEKALIEIERESGSEVIVFLLPAYTDVKWFHEIALPKASEIRFIKGRLKFGVHNNTAPFANMLLVFKRKEEDLIKEIVSEYDQSVLDELAKGGDGSYNSSSANVKEERV